MSDNDLQPFVVEQGRELLVADENERVYLSGSVDSYWDESQVVFGTRPDDRLTDVLLDASLVEREGVAIFGTTGSGKSGVGRMIASQVRTDDSTSVYVASHSSGIEEYVWTLDDEREVLAFGVRDEVVDDYGLSSGSFATFERQLTTPELAELTGVEIGEMGEITEVVLELLVCATAYTDGITRSRAAELPAELKKCCGSEQKVTDIPEFAPSNFPPHLTVKIEDCISRLEELDAHDIVPATRRFSELLERDDAFTGFADDYSVEEALNSADDIVIQTQFSDKESTRLATSVLEDVAGSLQSGDVFFCDDTCRGLHERRTFYGDTDASHLIVTQSVSESMLEAVPSMTPIVAFPTLNQKNDYRLGSRIGVRSQHALQELQAYEAFVHHPRTGAVKTSMFPQPVPVRTKNN